MSGTKIVDVFYTEWAETAPEEWSLVAKTDRIPISGNIDRVVYELPTGCYESDLRLGASVNTVTFQPASSAEAGPPLRKCQRQASAEVVATQEPAAP
jgi:hypothetical protein